MKIRLDILLAFICLLSCNQKAERSLKTKSVVVSQEFISNESELRGVKANQEISARRELVEKFLDSPFDLDAFKRAKKMSNSGGGREEEYYLKPDKDGLYYRYFLFSRMEGYLGTNKERVILKEDGLEITVYKERGEFQFEYIDPTEDLIEVKAKFNDFDLPELAFVGLDSISIVNKLGVPDLVQSECMVYQYKNKALILNLSNQRVMWLKYIVLKEDLDIEKHERLFK